jgi:hypothetical protein
MSTPPPTVTTNLLSRYNSPMRSPRSAPAYRPSSPLRVSPIRSAVSYVPAYHSPSRMIHSDSEYVANRINLAAADVEVRTLKAELVRPICLLLNLFVRVTGTEPQRCALSSHQSRGSGRRGSHAQSRTGIQESQSKYEMK